MHYEQLKAAVIHHDLLVDNLIYKVHTQTIVHIWEILKGAFYSIKIDFVAVWFICHFSRIVNFVPSLNVFITFLVQPKSGVMSCSKVVISWNATFNAWRQIRAGQKKSYRNYQWNHFTRIKTTFLTWMLACFSVVDSQIWSLLD